MTILAFDTYASNAHLIEAAAKLGYLRYEWRTLDVSFGQGTFWRRYRPDVLVTGDKYLALGDMLLDFTALPFPDRSFDCVAFDGPYKLNGTPSDTGGVDSRYGVERKATWRDRMALLRAGLRESARVLGDGYLLVKCQDQVSSGKVRWQTHDLTLHAEREGLGLVDRLDMRSYREQPADRGQVHARRVSSSLLVFKRGWDWRR